MLKISLKYVVRILLLKNSYFRICVLKLFGNFLNIKHVIFFVSLPYVNVCLKSASNKSNNTFKSLINEYIEKQYS